MDIVHAVAEIGDELEPLARLAEYRAVDVIGDRRHQDIDGFPRLHQLRLRQWLIVGIETRVEQFAHAHFDAVGQPTSDHDQELLARRHSLPLAYCLLRRLVPKFSPAIECFATAVCPSAVQVSLTPLAETAAGERSVKICSRWPYSQKARRSGWRACGR